jgi:hypothetical protein
LGRFRVSARGGLWRLLFRGTQMTTLDLSAGIELPQAFRQTDATSLAGQRDHLRAVRLELILLIAAAVAGLVSVVTTTGIDLAGLAGASLFVVALALRQHTAAHRPESRWYRARAAAESIKTLAWRFAVGGEPFGRDLSRHEAERAFVERLREVMADMGEVVLAVGDTSPATQITDSMVHLRGSSLVDRRAAYLDGRIEDQRRWYTSKAAYNALWFRRWSLATLVLEVVGVATGIAKSLGVVSFVGDLLGISAALVAAIAAWNQARQHGTLASSYAVAAQELAAVASLISHQYKESDWARFVESSEAAISREHTLWRASRSR